MINVLIALNSNQIQNFLDNFRFDVNGDRIRTDFAPFDADGVTLDPYDITDLNVNLGSDGLWKENLENGGVTTIVESMLVSDKIIQVLDESQELEPKLAMVEYLRNHYELTDARFQVLGAWEWDGSVATDENDKNLYNILNNYLKWMPDDVVYDENGDEVSRSDATEFKDVNLYFGQTPRIVI